MKPAHRMVTLYRTPSGIIAKRMPKFFFAPGKLIYRMLFFASAYIMTATVSATPDVLKDSLFSETTVLGTVFHDQNRNKVRDPGEPGMPGVRLATVTGLLIETDGYGRFHIPDDSGSQSDRAIRGSFTSRVFYSVNTALKVDAASLPVEAEVTTENPRVIRTTAAGLSHVNFGVYF